MPEDHHLPGCVRFGVFEVDLRGGELRKYGLRIKLQEQPFQVLVMLLEHAGEVVSREELQKKLWPADTFVDFDHGLNKAINKIREALGDSAGSPRFVETVARRGYRFLAEVKVADAIVAHDAGSLSQSLPMATIPSLPDLAVKRATPNHYLPSLGVKISIVVAVALMAVLAAWMLRFRNRPSPVIRSLAVLPLDSLSGDASQDYFADGMTDELITDLGQISALRVISRTSVMRYKRVREPLPQIARELGVDAIVEGTVLRSENRVRITAQLIEAPADKHLWAQSYEGDLRDTLALQKQVARTIADQVRINLTPREQLILKTARTVNPEAYEDYLKGRYFWNKRTGEGLKKATEYFNDAIEKDPTFGQAYAGLADSYALLGNGDFAVASPREAYPKAKAAATKALELDNSLGEAHTSLAETALLTAPQRTISFAEVLLGAFLVIGHNVFRIVPNEVPFLFALFWISFGIREHGWKRPGLTLPNSWTLTFLWAVGAAIALLVGSELVVQPLAHHFWPQPEHVSSLIKNQGGWKNLLRS